MRSVKNYITIALCFILLAIAGPAAGIEMVSITGDDVNMRSGPGTNYRVMWELGDGYPLIVLKRKDNWYRVRDFEGTIGWVHKDVADRTPHMIVKVHKNSRKRINVRSGPGTKYRIVAKAYYGVVFKTLQQKNGWVNVEHEKGVTG